MSETKTKLLEKFLKEFMTSRDLTEEQDKAIFEVLNIIKENRLEPIE